MGGARNQSAVTPPGNLLGYLTASVWNALPGNFLRLKGLSYAWRPWGMRRRGIHVRSGLVGTGLRGKLTRRNGAVMGILVTGGTGCTLLPLVTGVGIRGIIRLTRGRLL